MSGSDRLRTLGYYASLTYMRRLTLRSLAREWPCGCFLVGLSVGLASLSSQAIAIPPALPGPPEAQVVAAKGLWASRPIDDFLFDQAMKKAAFQLSSEWQAIANRRLGLNASLWLTDQILGRARISRPALYKATSECMAINLAESHTVQQIEDLKVFAMTTSGEVFLKYYISTQDRLSFCLKGPVQSLSDPYFKSDMLKAKKIR